MTSSMNDDDPRLVAERINLDIVDAARKLDGQVTVDDILPAAASRSVILPFKKLEEKGMRRITIAMKHFMRNHSRFLDFTKEGIVEGLRQEWLPTLDGDDKVRLFGDITLVADIDENGVVGFNEKLYKVYVEHPKPDSLKYGSEPYSPRVASKRRSLPKVKLQSAEPIKDLAAFLAPYVDWYKKNWSYFQRQEIEGYKWTAMQHFQKTFEIDAADLAANLRDALSKENNLLSGPMYTPKSLLIKNAALSPDEVRGALVDLFDESRPVYQRVDEFLATFAEIHEGNKRAGHHKERDRDMQSERAASVYLSFMHPDKHYLYKFTMWNDFVDTIGFQCKPLSKYPSKLYGYDLYCDQIREVLLADAELTALLERDQPEDNSNGHLLTQDFIYCIAYHYLGLDKAPRQY